MSKRMRLTADEVLEMVLQESDDEDMGEIDDPHEPILDGSDDDFEDLCDQLNQELDEGMTYSAGLDLIT